MNKAPVFLGVLLGKTQNIIKLHKNKDVQKISGDVINRGLEDGWGIKEAK